MEPKNRLAFIQVGINISNTVRATLGPKGMNKMVIDSNNNQPILTNDGATIIKNLAIEHPIGSMFKGLAEGQEKAIGDGTTTTTLLAGQLLENALSLINKNLHPITIIGGYNLARNEAIRFATSQSLQGDRRQVMKTTFGSKISSQASDVLTELLVDADLESLRISKSENKSFDETKVISGYVLDGFTINDRMPSEATGKVAVLDLKNNMEFAKFNIQSTDELNKLENRQRDYKKDIVNQLANNGVKILFYSDTNPEFESFLTEAGIMSVVVYKREYLDNICKATGCVSIADPTSDFSNYLGLGHVKYVKEDGGVYIFNDESKIKTLLLCGPTKQVLDETERAVDDVLRILKHFGNVVVGGGAFEIELAKHLRDYASKIGGKEQLAIEKYADSVESIPLILAENCGFDAIEVLSILKTAHKNGQKNIGVDPMILVSDALERGVVEPVDLKVHSISSATDVANLILKLDDIYQGSEKK